MTPPPDPAQTRELLRQSEERYRLLVESVKDYAIFMLDPAGHVVTWNEGARRIKGYKAEEIIGRHFSTFYPPEDLAAGKTEHELEVAGREGRFEDEGWRLRKDGSRFWANVVITALRDRGGTLRGFAKVTRDLTARRQAEEQARHLAREQAARSAAEAAAARKDEFVSLLAHELRNPLAPIPASLALLRDQRVDPARRAAALETVDRQVRHLTRLVDDLLDVARITRGTVELRCERLDLARLVRVGAADVLPLLEQAGLELSLEVPETPVWVRGDEVRLGQVVSNLLDNARKFTPRGGRVTVRLGVEAEGSGAVLTVTDTGVGIPADILPRLFEPLSQEDRSLERTKGGLGLGLAVVKKLVQLHEGSVGVSSEGPGRGVAFRVRLPLEQEPPPLVEAPASPTPTAARHQVLVVEDNQTAAHSLQMLLEWLGHQVRVAASGPEGVALAREWRPDVIISDIGLPGLNGYEVARQLRQQPGLEKVLLIALTGYGGSEDRRKSREAGFDHHLVKPADPDELQHLLEGQDA